MLKKMSAALLALAIGVSSAAAQDSAPIRIVIGFAAGGVTDILARVLSDEMGKRLNTTVIVENRPGGAGSIAVQQVSRAKPDGTTLIMIPGTYTIVPAIRTLDFDTKTALTPISLIASAPSMLAVAKNTKYTNVKEVIADAAARPGEIPYGSSGVGSTSHFMGILFEREAKVKLNHIPFKSSGESLQAVLGGHIPMSFSAVNSALSAVQAGEVRALAMGSAKRSSFLPDVPTFGELGLPKVLSETWIGLCGPADMPSALVQKINAAVMEAVKMPEIQKRLQEIGVDVLAEGPEQFKKTINDEVDLYESLARSMNLARQ